MSWPPSDAAFMAHGHLIPFLTPTGRIHRQIPLATTPLNLHYLSSTMSPDSTSFHSAAPTESTENLPPDQMVRHCSIRPCLSPFPSSTSFPHNRRRGAARLFA
ncbi:hypothetical protein ACJRO7_029588 [Eucalyptus globulus]|uniref:Uncharacterized protein n=1 Tax=Eucalyptus globulus TaxID=34317 RepID=A0ABD3JAH4_EUCGL